MKRIIKEGLITTIIGLLVISFSGAMIWSGRSTAQDMSGWLAFGIMFLRSKDSLIGISKGDGDI